MSETVRTGYAGVMGPPERQARAGGVGLMSSAAATRELLRRPAPGEPRRPRPPKLYRIGEVVEYSAMSRQTIHNYTTMGLLQETKWTAGGHRLYDESVFERLDTIAELKAQSKSLHDIREYFARHEGAPGPGAAEGNRSLPDASG